MHTDTRRTFLRHLGGAAALLSSAVRGAGVEEILSLSTVALARQIREKKISATEAVHASIACIQAVNPKLNAVVQTCFDRALREAKEIDRRRRRAAYWVRYTASR